VGAARLGRRHTDEQGEPLGEPEGSAPLAGRSLARAFAGGLGAGVTYIVPFVLWAIGVIPRYTVAAWVAVVVVSVSWLACAVMRAGEP
jgi:hypothetical protein